MKKPVVCSIKDDDVWGAQKTQNDYHTLLEFRSSEMKNLSGKPIEALVKFDSKWTINYMMIERGLLNSPGTKEHFITRGCTYSSFKGQSHPETKHTGTPQTCTLSE